MPENKTSILLALILVIVLIGLLVPIVINVLTTFFTPSILQMMAVFGAVLVAGIGYWAFFRSSNESTETYATQMANKAMEQFKINTGMNKVRSILEVDQPKTAVYAYKCPQCAAPLNFPRAEDTTKCAYCGSEVHRRREDG
jgi:DNA-directed RNA polymerase subunit RPC12/RpoP